MEQMQQYINQSGLDAVLKYFQSFMPELTSKDLVMLLQYCEFRKFPAKTKIVREGEIDNYLNMVAKGLVRKYIVVNKTEQTLQLATEGHVVNSELSFLTGNPSVMVLETLEPTVLVSLRQDKMEEALEKFEHGERLGRMILTAMYIKKDERRYARASKTVRERFLDYMAHHPHMLQRIPQKYLASYLNIKPETFSRMKHLAARKN
jgi:CRP-like cAMP-binding protein